MAEPLTDAEWETWRGMLSIPRDGEFVSLQVVVLERLLATIADRDAEIARLRAKLELRNELEAASAMTSMLEEQDRTSSSKWRERVRKLLAAMDPDTQ